MIRTAKTRKRYHHTASAVLAALVASAIAGIVCQTDPSRLALAQVNHRAFTITTTQKMACFRPGEPMDFGDVRAFKVQTVAMRSDGSQVVKMNMVERGTIDRRIELASGEYEVAFDEVNLKSHWRLEGAILLDRPDPKRNCLATHRGLSAYEGTQVEGYEILNNLRTVRVRAGPSGGKDGSWTHKRWHALDYACAVVKEDSLFTPPPEYKQPDGTTLVTRNVTELVSVQDGEPDPQLFFTGTQSNVKPSQRFAARMEFEATRAGRKIDQAAIDSLTSSDVMKKQDAEWEAAQK